MTVLHGVVTKSGVMAKTVTVTVSRKVVHPILLKEMTRHKKFLVHDEEEAATLSDNVTIKLGKPMSKRKSFHLVSVDGKVASLAAHDLPIDSSEDAARVKETPTPGQERAQARKEESQRDWSEERRKVKEAARVEALKRLGVNA